MNVCLSVEFLYHSFAATTKSMHPTGNVRIVRGETILHTTVNAATEKAIEGFFSNATTRMKRSKEPASTTT